jgi:hypothetical protein
MFQMYYGPTNSLLRLPTPQTSSGIRPRRTVQGLFKLTAKSINRDPHGMSFTNTYTGFRKAEL